MLSSGAVCWRGGRGRFGGVTAAAGAGGCRGLTAGAEAPPGLPAPGGQHLGQPAGSARVREPREAPALLPLGHHNGAGCCAATAWGHAARRERSHRTAAEGVREPRLYAGSRRAEAPCEALRWRKRWFVRGGEVQPRCAH